MVAHAPYRFEVVGGDAGGERYYETGHIVASHPYVSVLVLDKACEHLIAVGAREQPLYLGQGAVFGVEYFKAVHSGGPDVSQGVVLRYVEYGIVALVVELGVLHLGEHIRGLGRRRIELDDAAKPCAYPEEFARSVFYDACGVFFKRPLIVLPVVLLGVVEAYSSFRKACPYPSGPVLIQVFYAGRPVVPQYGVFLKQ